MTWKIEDDPCPHPEDMRFVQYEDDVYITGKSVSRRKTWCSRCHELLKTEERLYPDFTGLEQ